MGEKSEVTVLMTNVRFSYLYAFKPYEGDDGKKSYGAHGIFDESQPFEPLPHARPSFLKPGEKITLKEALQRAIRQVAADKWGEKAKDILQQLAGQDRLCLHRGDVSKAGQAPYVGKLYVSANGSTRPNTFDSKGQQVNEANAPEAVYSGCIGHMVVQVWAQDNKFGKRINASPMGFKFVRHEERLSGGGRVASADEFGGTPTDADGEAPETTGAGDGLI